jgi:copper transport protein
MRRRLAAALAAAAVLALALPVAASAHAQLEGVTPQRGAVVQQQPGAVVFRFDEAVEGNFGAVRVYDRAGERADAGDAFHPDGHGEQLGVHLKPGLSDGTYTATYRVVSADGHIVSGGSTFSVGEASGAGETVAELLEGSNTGPVTEVVDGIAKGLTFAAVAVLVGGLGFLWWTWGWAAATAQAGAQADAALRRRLRRLLTGASLVGALGAAAFVVLEGAEAAGISGWSALDWDIVSETLGTSIGRVWGIAVLVWLAAAALSWFALRPAPRTAGTAATAPLALLAVAAAALVLVPGLGGHARTQDPVWLLLPANVIHVAAMGLWAGGLVLLIAALPAATRTLEPAARTRLLAGTLARFSPMALTAVAVLTVAGVVQAVVEVNAFSALLDTAFGRAVLIKVILLCGLISIGAWHRRSSIPGLRAIAAAGQSPAAAGVAVRRALRAEVALIVVVLGVTAALSSYPPSTVQASGPVNRTTTVGPAQLQVTVDPATVGANEIHLYLLDPRDGSQWDKAKQVTLRASQSDRGIGPLDIELSKAGPGHYVTSGSAALGVPGDWTLDVAVRVSDFDQYEQQIEVPIR